MNLNIRFPEGRRKTLTLSYDDGVVQDKRFIELLDKYGMKATFNINTDCYLAETAKRDEYYGRLKKSEAKELYIGSGHEVAVHTLTHPYIVSLRKQDILNEILEDRRRIEEDYGVIVRGMAYPFGCFSDEVVEAMEASGIAYSRTTISTESFRLPNDWMRLETTCHHNNPRLMELAKKFREETPRWTGEAWMFYLWGHTYEFDNNDNWNVIEEFAEYIGGCSEIWYATNIEIYDYIAAFKNLQTSLDNKVIYNPSAITVWFEAAGKIYSIASGETLHID